MSDLKMTRSELRIYFAGMALTGLLSDSDIRSEENIAAGCFDYAEAMVKEFERREEKGKRSKINE